MKRIVFGLVVLGMVGFLTDCKKKYPDDSKWPPNFRTPMKRLTRKTWKINSYTKLINFGYVPTLDKMTVQFNTEGYCSGGDCSVVIPGQPQAYFATNFCFSGTWALIEDDSKLKISSGSNNIIWTINKLDYKDMEIANDSVDLKMSNQ